MTPATEDTRTEAEAQRQETVTPLFWGALGLAAVLVFGAFLFLGDRQGGSTQPVVAPMEAPRT